MNNSLSQHHLETMYQKLLMSLNMADEEEQILPILKLMEIINRQLDSFK